MDFWALLGFIVVDVVGMALAYWLGWRHHRASVADLPGEWVRVIAIMPADLPGLDIPRESDTKRMPC